MPAAIAVAWYGALRETIDRIGRELAGRGVLPGDVVALTGDNGPEILVAFFAVVAAGASAAPTPGAEIVPELASRDDEPIVEKTRYSAFVTRAWSRSSRPSGPTP